MRILRTLDEMREEASANLRREATVGFVPTMGALHEGHGSLIRRAAEENDVAVVSLFVNPTQFNDPEDFEKYPRDLEADAELCEDWGAQVLFAPEAAAMYPDGFRTSVSVQGLTDHLCGISRGRGHFAGVCTVVAKLLHLVAPTRAYFGRKDAQQALVIARMVEDLDFPVEIVACPTVREEDGLALSSRNRRLPEHLRPDALRLIEALRLGRDRIAGGETDGQAVAGAMAEHVLRSPAIELDYLNVCRPATLEDAERIEGPVLLAGAIVVGGVRLIDNLFVDPEKSDEE